MSAYDDPALSARVVHASGLSWTARGIMLSALAHDGWLSSDDLTPTPAAARYEDADDIAAAVLELRALELVTVSALGTLQVLPPAGWAL